MAVEHHGKLWHRIVMPIYIYETIPQSELEKPRRFEVKQSMKDVPLMQHPETGEAVRRVITGGAGLMGVGRSTSPTTASGGGCGSGCGCH